jgi:hypothetical protein
LASIESEYVGMPIYRGSKNGQQARYFWREPGKLVQSKANSDPIASSCEDRSKVSSRATKQN